jgi:hypothetical protein
MFFLPFYFHYPTIVSFTLSPQIAPPRSPEESTFKDIYHPWMQTGVFSKAGDGPILIQTGRQQAIFPIVANYFFNTPYTSDAATASRGQNGRPEENGAGSGSPAFNPTLTRQILYFLS